MSKVETGRNSFIIYSFIYLLRLLSTFFQDCCGFCLRVVYASGCLLFKKIKFHLSMTSLFGWNVNK